MSNRARRLGKGLKRDYRQDLLGDKIQKSKGLDTQKSRDLEIKKPRRQATIYLTKEQFRAIKEIQLQLLDQDFKIENSQIAGLAIEILREILKSPDIQTSRDLEALKSRCLEVLKEARKV